MIDIAKISIENLKRAVAVKEQIQALELEFSALLNGGGTGASQVGVGRGRGMSASGRARIAAAQRLRWARQRNGALPALLGGATAPKEAPKRKMSAAGRARISATARARWAKAKAEGRSRL